jgi:hypothetical protein
LIGGASGVVNLIKVNSKSTVRLEKVSHMEIRKSEGVVDIVLLCYYFSNIYNSLSK